MTELQETDKEASGNHLDNQPASPGEVLQAARVARQLTQQDISNSLRYSVKQVDALEKGNFDLLPDAMITRGFIRNYAKLLEIDAEPLLASYRLAVSSQPERVIAVKSSMRPVQLTKESRPWLKYILGSILVLLFLLAWLFYIDYMPKPSPAAVDTSSSAAEKAIALPAEALPEIALPAAQRQAGDNAAASDVTVAADAVPGDVPALPAAALDTKPADAVVQPGQQGAALPAAQQPPQPVVAADKALAMTFTALSWVSVTDKSGKAIYEKNSHSGDKVTISAAPPLSLVIGNANGTRLNVDGRDIDLAPNTKDNVARITLE